MTAKQLTVEALDLPVQDRISLAQALWESLTAGASAEQTDLETLAAATRRGQELDAEIVKGITREEAMRAARAALQ